MGLNIGMTVRKQIEGYMCEGSNPRGTMEEINADFDTFLRERFPDQAFNPRVYLRTDGYYIFDVRIGYGFPEQDKMYLAITEFVYDHFSHNDGIALQTYWSG